VPIFIDRGAPLYAKERCGSLRVIVPALLFAASAPLVFGRILPPPWRC
jgi:hypothetical protein